MMSHMQTLLAGEGAPWLQPLIIDELSTTHTINGANLRPITESARKLGGNSMRKFVILATLVSSVGTATAATNLNGFTVYGDIEKHWLQVGGAHSSLGAPIGNEHDQIGHGRVQRFRGGVMSWTPEAGSVQRLIGGDATTFDTGYVPSDLAMGGSMQLTVHRNGDYQLKVHAHDSGATNIEYGFSAMLVGADGQPFTFSHAGHLEGTSGSLFSHPKRNDDPPLFAGHDARLAASYNQLVETGSFIGKLTGRDKFLGGLQDLVEQAAKSLATAGIAAGTKAAIALVL